MGKVSRKGGGSLPFPIHLDKNVGRRGSRSEWIWGPKRGAEGGGLELNLHLDRLRTDNWWPKVELVQTLLGKWLAQGSPREIPFQRFPVSDVTGHCQLGNPETPALGSVCISLPIFQLWMGVPWGTSFTNGNAWGLPPQERNKHNRNGSQKTFLPPYTAGRSRQYLSFSKDRWRCQFSHRRLVVPSV